MLLDPAACVARVLDFAGTEADASLVRAAVEKHPPARNRPAPLPPGVREMILESEPAAVARRLGYSLSA